MRKMRKKKQEARVRRDCREGDTQEGGRIEEGEW